LSAGKIIPIKDREGCVYDAGIEKKEKDRDIEGKTRRTDSDREKWRCRWGRGQTTRQNNMIGC